MYLQINNPTQRDDEIFARILAMVDVYRLIIPSREMKKSWPEINSPWLTSSVVDTAQLH
jgi:hypothetical protein